MPVILKPNELDLWIHDCTAAELLMCGDPPVLNIKQHKKEQCIKASTNKDNLRNAS
jgi:hypothetical protein